MSVSCSRLLVLLGLFSLAGCSVGPDYHRPETAVALPVDWRWQRAHPRDEVDKGPWWQIFRDRGLSALEEQAAERNQNLKVAVANVDAARAEARITGANFFPFLHLDPAYSRHQIPKDNPQFAKVPVPNILQRFEPYNSYSVPLDLSYELDLWGRVRRSFTSAENQAQATIADYHNVLLTLTSDVATDYFTLRENDRETQILRDSIQFRSTAVDINKKRVTAGRATELDVAQAETDLTNAEADLAQVQQQRASTESALAVLCGDNASQFFVPVNPLAPTPPFVPAGLPSSLLERRPDVAEAERTMASKNELIGVAAAAFYPTVTLTGQGGYLSARATDLFTWKNSVWSYGPSVSIPLFLGGQNASTLQQARANYGASVASYRGTVLSAVSDVETALSDLHFLRLQQNALQKSVQSAQDAVKISNQRFRVGEVTYTDVVISDETRLSTQRNLVQVEGQLFYATIRLIKALGGGWTSDQMIIQQSAYSPLKTI